VKSLLKEGCIFFGKKERPESTIAIGIFDLEKSNKTKKLETKSGMSFTLKIIKK
jgi:hypothetical protein